MTTSPLKEELDFTQPVKVSPAEIGPANLYGRLISRSNRLSRILGPTTFSALRQANDAFGLRMLSMSELIPVIYSSSRNPGGLISKEVIHRLNYSWLTGDTAILPGSKGIFFQDKSKTEDGRVVMNEKKLENKLGSYQERGAVFSDDRSIRFAPYGFETELLRSKEIPKNSGVIAWGGSVENAEMLAELSRSYKEPPYFWVKSNVALPEYFGPKSNVINPRIRIADINGNGDSNGRLNIGADGFEIENNVRYSFGVPISD